MAPNVLSYIIQNEIKQIKCHRYKIIFTMFVHAKGKEIQKPVTVLKLQ